MISVPGRFSKNPNVVRNLKMLFNLFKLISSGKSLPLRLTPPSSYGKGWVLVGFGLSRRVNLHINSYPSALRRTKFWPRERAHFSSSISFVKRILRVNGLR